MKVYTRIKSAASIANLVFVCCIFITSISKAKDPEWLYIFPGDRVEVYKEQGEFVWISTPSTYHEVIKINKENKSKVETIQIEGRFLDTDSDGNLWIANQTGFARYNNNKLTLFDDSTFSDIEVKDMFITSMKVDKQNNVWFGTDVSGIIKFDGKEFTVFNSQNSGLPKHPNQNNVMVTSIDFDADNNGWFGFIYGGIAKYDGNSWKIFNDTNSALPSYKINDIRTDKKGNVWISSLKGLGKYDGKNWSIYNKSKTGYKIENCRNIAIDKSDNIWISLDAYNGVAVFDGDDFKFYNIENSGLKGNDIFIFFIDNNDNKWFSVSNGSGYNGINIYRKGGIIFTSVNGSNEDFAGISVYPNPASDFLTIQTSEVLKTSEVYNVQIFNTLGIEVASTLSVGADTPQEGNFRIDISDLQPGVYFIRIGDRVEKFVKM